MFKSIVIGLCALVMLAITPSVQTDPIVINSGQLTVVGIAGQPSYTNNGAVVEDGLRR